MKQYVPNQISDVKLYRTTQERVEGLSDEELETASGGGVLAKIIGRPSEIFHDAQESFPPSAPNTLGSHVVKNRLVYERAGSYLLTGGAAGFLTGENIHS